MFGKTGQAEGARSVIASDVRIEGSVHTDGVLEFDGRIEGDLSAQALVVGRAAVVEGNVSGGFVTVDGSVRGDVSATTLVVKPTAKVDGTLAYDTVTVDSGAEINGKFRRLAPQGAKAGVPAGDKAPA
ncbi:MAG: bactofilin family protein [Alkalilacustris sp.]